MTEGDGADPVEGAGTSAPKASLQPNPTGAVFVSYASQDASAASRIAGALRAAGIEVWFDRSELRGGDAWDQSIRKQIRTCALFLPVISRNTHDRDEGYFRLEWKLAVDRCHLMAADKTFLLPVVIDDTRDADERVPERFREVQWTRLTTGVNADAFVERVRRLLSPDATAPVAASARSLVRPTSSTATASTRSTAPASLSFVRWVVGGFLLLVVGYIAFDKAWLPRRDAGYRAPTTGDFAAPVSAPGTSVIPEKSVAVLPFTDLSEKKDQEYFADGIADEILNLLAKIPQLKVVGRTSSFRYKGKADDLRAIGAALGAAYVVDGSVRRSGNHVRITVELMDARDGAQRWSETYDRDVTDILRVQVEIAANLVRGLQLAVAPSLLSQWASAKHNPEAYDLYLRAQHAIYRFNASGFEQAIGYLRRALEIDPPFVAAAESLALSVFDQAEMGFVAPHPGYEQARAAASAVLRLEPNSGAAHAVLGGVLFEHEWAWEAAERELNIAATLAPRNPFVLIVAAEERMAVADWRGALDLLNTTNAADPMDAATYTSLACVYLHLGRAIEAEAAARRVLEISPTYSGAHSWLATVLLMEGKPEVALTEANIDNPQGNPTPLLVAIYHGLHRSRESDAMLARLDGRKLARATLAGAYAYTGQRDETMDLLEQAFASHEPELTWINYDPLLMRMANEPRFKRLLLNMKLPK